MASDDNSKVTPSAGREHWFEANEYASLPHVVHPEGRQLSRRLNLYLLLGAFAPIPLVMLAVQLGVSPLAAGISYAVFALAALAWVAIWYVRTAARKTLVVPYQERRR